jgi:hypothetical protein
MALILDHHGVADYRHAFVRGLSVNESVKPKKKRQSRKHVPRRLTTRDSTRSARRRTISCKLTGRKR